MCGHDHSRYAWDLRDQALFDQLLPHAQRRAIETRLKGYHHSGFLVGACGLGVFSGGGPRAKFFWGSNYKPERGTEGPRVCAEHEMEAHAVLSGCSHLLGFTIAAFYKEDDESGADINGCLMPCVHCRRRFEESFRENGIYRPQTICESMRLENRGGEVVVARVGRISLGRLLERHPPSAT